MSSSSPRGRHRRLRHERRCSADPFARTRRPPDAGARLHVRMDEASLRALDAEGAVFMSEWANLRSVRSTKWPLAAAFVLTIGLPALAPAIVAHHWTHMD